MLYDLAMFWNSCRKMKNHLGFHSKWWDSTASAMPWHSRQGTTLLPRYRIKRCFASSSSALAARKCKTWRVTSEIWQCESQRTEKIEKNNSCRINDIITHATCAVFVAFWFPWLQMTKPALSPRIWSNYTVYAREILHTHSWYNINYASIILRGSFALLDMLRAAIWSLCFALSFHSFSSAISLSFPLCDSLCLLQAAAKDAPSLACERKRLSCRHSDRNTANLAFECLAVEPCIVHISWLVMGRTTQIACCDESSDHVRYTVWSLNVGISGWDVIGCRLALKNILSGLPFNYIL